MTVIARLLRLLSLRRLNIRARQVFDLGADPLITVYPRPLVIEPPGGCRVVVLAPHADDETFGAGGTIVRHVDAGDHVAVILFSNNVASIPGPELTDGEKCALRAEEFHRAMDVLGVQERHAFDLDAVAFRKRDGCPRMRETLIGNPPRVLYLPSLFDNHEDHRVINLWAAEELSRRPHVSCLVRSYEVWSPLPANTVSDISTQTERKKRAIACYQTQLAMVDYTHHILGLNAYRAMTEPVGTRYAEAFFEAPSDRYIELVDQYLNT